MASSPSELGLGIQRSCGKDKRPGEPSKGKIPALARPYPGARSTLSALLWAQGYFVSLAGTLAEAELAAAERPQLVLVDLHLKEGKSYAFGRWLKAQGIPFLMLSGERRSLEKVLPLELGAEDYITKPFDKAEFFARFRVALRRQGAGQRGAEDLVQGPFGCVLSAAVSMAPRASRL